MTTAERYRTVPFRKLAAAVYEWDPKDHDGEREPWESMEATMNDGWSAHLALNHAQETMDAPVTERDTDLRTDRRRVLRRAWVLPNDVPPELARRCSMDVLNGYLTYDPEDPAWPA